MGIKKVRFACLPSEVKDISIKEYMKKYGEVNSILMSFGLLHTDIIFIMV